MRIVRRRPPANANPEFPESMPGVLRRVFANRGIREAGELDLSLKRLLPPWSLRGLDGACELLAHALQWQWRVLVVGDFDADGATSTALAVSALREFGFAHVDYLVPDRFRFGYGLTPQIVALAEERAPDLIITVDNGISSHAGVRAARAAGIRVLVTDHHLPGSDLPEAHAIVNPNQPDCGFPGKSLAGVGVIFYTLLGLRAYLRECGWYEHPLPSMDVYLDLVALGTVADVVPLDHNNRILVAQGLRRIRFGRSRPGVEALFQVAGRSPEQAVAADLGFAIGPRLNAAGRLEDMRIGIECLLAKDGAAAMALAQRLDALNRERRDMQATMSDQALKAVDRLNLAGTERLPAGIALFDPDWHSGIVGLVASRVKERHHRPVIAFAPDGSGGLKGSARSIAGVHIRDVLDAVAAAHPGLIERFGGHAMAAGLSLSADHLPQFQTAFAAEVARRITPDQLTGALFSDGELGPGERDLATALALPEAAPWGQGFAEPSFDGVFQIYSRRIVGGRHLRCVLRSSASPDLQAIFFNVDDVEQVQDTVARPGASVRAVYRLGVNDYRGEQTPQLVVEYLKPA